MAYCKLKTEGGSGGKLGHSNMSHWDETEWVKEQSRKTRRLQTKQIIQKTLKQPENIQ